MPPVRRPQRKRQRHFLRAWRIFRGMTLEQAAERIGVDHSTLQRIEVGKSPYNQDHLELLAESYRCNPDDLIRRDPATISEADDIARQVAQAPPEIQRQISAVIAALLKTPR